MEPGTYKHARCKDVAIHVVRANKKDNGWSVVVWWINVTNPVKTYLCWPDPVVEFISDEQLPNWRPFHASV